MHLACAVGHPRQPPTQMFAVSPAATERLISQLNLALEGIG